MNKPATNSRWSQLTPEQLQKLEHWLFDEKLTYPVTLERAQKNFGFSGSVSSLQRFYYRRSKERLLHGFKEICQRAKIIETAPGQTAALRSAAMKMIGKLFLKRITDNPDEIEQWEPLARLVLQSEDNELRRQLKTEENLIRRQSLNFSKEKFQFNTVEEALKILPHLQELVEARKDPDTQFFEQGKRLNHIKEKMFGDDNTYWHPENLEQAKAQIREAAANHTHPPPHVKEFLEERAARLAAEEEENDDDATLDNEETIEGENESHSG